MGKKVAYTNNTQKIQHVGPKTLWPNDTREVDVDDLQMDERKKYLGDVAEQPEPEANPVLATLDLSITKIIEKLAERDEEGSPVISDKDITVLEQAEQAGKTRAGALEAFANERLARSSNAINAEQLAKALAEMDIQELHDQFDVHKEDLGSLFIIENAWREKMAVLDDDGRMKVMETLEEGSRQAAILNEVISA